MLSGDLNAAALSNDATSLTLQGGYSGNAAGFKLSSLLKLTDVSAHKPRMNLLHFVAQQLEQKNPRLLKVADDFDSLTDAAAHSVETITTEVTQLKEGVKSVEAQLEQLEEGDFRQQITDFLDVSAHACARTPRDVIIAVMIVMMMMITRCWSKVTHGVEASVFHSLPAHDNNDCCLSSSIVTLEMCPHNALN